MDQRAFIGSETYASRLASLPAKQRQAFDWYRSGRSLLELARATGRSRSTLTYNLEEARRKMQGA